MLEKLGQLRGYYLLNRIGGQCRIIDLYVDSAAPPDWQAAYRLAVNDAASQPQTCEITTFCSLPWVGKLLESEGFHQRDERPAMLFGREKSFAGAQQVHLQMVECDAFVVYSPSYPYLT